MRFDRVTFLIFAIVATVVFSSAWVLQRSLDSAQRTAQNTTDLRVVAEQRVAGTLDGCKALNAQRDAQIATSEAAIRAAAQAPPTMLTNEGRLLLTAFVQRTNQAIEKVSAPKKCTVKALHLGELAAIAAGSGG